MNYKAVPSAIFTTPEIAIVGISEKEAKELDLEINVGKFPYAANGKALAMGDDRGFVKIISDKDDKIIGGAVVGIAASDLISNITIAIANGLSASDLGKTIFAHPTTSEVIHEGVLSVLDGALHY